MTSVVRQLKHGQIAIPAEFRRELGIEEDALLQLTLLDGELRIRPIPVADQTSGSPWLRELYEYFAPAREEILARGIPEAEVNADIDAAIAAVRAARAERR